MEESWVYIGVGVAAALGVKLVRRMGPGLRPALVGLIKVGIGVNEEVRGFAAGVATGVASARASATGGWRDLRREAEAERGEAAGAPAAESAAKPGPKRIVIARD